MTGSSLDFADKTEDEGGSRLVIDVVGGADLLDLALAHDAEAIGQFEGFFLIMGDEDRGVAGAVVHFAQPLAQLAADLGIKRAKGLVEQQHGGLDGEGPGERDALALAARELVGIALFEARELDQIEQLHGAAADLAGGRAGGARAHLEAERDVLEDRHMAEQRIVLEHEADIALLDGLFRGIGIAKEYLAGGGHFQARNEPQQRGLARAGWPQQRDQFTRTDIERDIVECGETVEFLAHIDYANVHYSISYQ